MLVQCEVDGFQLPNNNAVSALKICAGVEKEATDELISALTKLKLKPDQESRAFDTSLLTVLPYVGYEASHEDLVELKTRSSSHPFPLTEEDIYAQAVFSATPTTIAAIHD